jgi:hypothetical protein
MTAEIFMNAHAIERNDRWTMTHKEVRLFPTSYASYWRKPINP